MSMRQRKEVQEMLWRNCLVSILFISSSLLADGLAAADRPVWKEYGHEATERIASGSAQVTAHRFKDTTGAFAALQWLRGDPAIGGLLAQLDNYVLLFEGTKPSAEQIQQLGASLPDRRRASLPTIQNYLPDERRIPGSERYIAGPVSLEKFEPRVPASVIGFDQGAEAQVARYRMGGGEEQLLLVSYPTPQIAMERLKSFQGLAGAVRRSGPLLAVVPAPVNQSAAETLVSQVSYQSNLIWNERTPEDPRKVGDMLLAICLLALGLMVGSVLLGVFFGGVRRLFARFGIGAGDDSLTELNLQQPQI